MIIATGDRVRHFTIGRGRLLLGSAVTALVLAAVVAIPVRYALTMPPEEGAQAERQWQSRNDYEQRIATLRAELDRATSRQFLAQKLVESKVDVLLDQQEQLAARYEKLQPLFDRAKSTGLLTPVIPIPTPKPDAEVWDVTADSVAGSVVIDGADDGVDPSVDDANEPDQSPIPEAHAFAPVAPASGIDWLGRLRAEAAPEPVKTSRVSGQTASVISDESLLRIGAAISTVEFAQLRNLETLASSARGRAVRISSALAAAGIPISDAPGQERAEGGPFEPVPAADTFDDTVAELDSALAELQRVSAFARKLPLERPLPASTISSTFGIRADPFLGKRALHAGVDFAERQGRAIHATAPGTIIKAGNYGGYGNMVEIDHGNGITTRYGHMSKVSAKVGQVVRRGATIGAIGSTGRSTGPHLHYEVRRNGVAVDPAKFFRIGDKIRDFG